MITIDREEEDVTFLRECREVFERQALDLQLARQTPGTAGNEQLE